MLIRLILLSLLFGLSSWAFADDIVLKLKDGSFVRGELITFSDGIYTVDSASLGILKIKSDSVGSIESSNNTASNGGVDSHLQNQLADINTKLTQDEEAMAMIMSLQNSPDMQAILADDEIMRAIQTMDYDALMNNPKIIKLMDNAQIRAIQERIQ
jgi:hypothetical protein